MITIESIQRACKTSSGKNKAVLFAALLAEIWYWQSRKLNRFADAYTLLEQSGEFADATWNI